MRNQIVMGLWLGLSMSLTASASDIPNNQEALAEPQKLLPLFKYAQDNSLFKRGEAEKTPELHFKYKTEKIIKEEELVKLNETAFKSAVHKLPVEMKINKDTKVVYSNASFITGKNDTKVVINWHGKFAKDFKINKEQLVNIINHSNELYVNQTLKAEALYKKFEILVVSKVDESKKENSRLRYPGKSANLRNYNRKQYPGYDYSDNYGYDYSDNYGYDYSDNYGYDYGYDNYGDDYSDNYGDYPSYGDSYGGRSDYSQYDDSYPSDYSPAYGSRDRFLRHNSYMTRHHKRSHHKRSSSESPVKPGEKIIGHLVYAVKMN